MTDDLVPVLRDIMQPPSRASVTDQKPYNPTERICELEQALKNAALTFYELGFLMARQKRVKTAKYCNDAGKGCCDVLYKGIS